MAEDINTHPPEDRRPGEGVETLGSILTTAREMNGLTVEQMAVELRVELRLMKALEEDRFEVLPAPVFVKGYLRHLANRFGLDHDDLLHCYTRQTDTEDAPVTYSEPIREESRFLAPLLIGALVLILGIPALWFIWAGRDLFSDIGSSDAEAPSPPPAQIGSVPEEAATLPGPGVAVAPGAQPSAVEPGPVEPAAQPSAVEPGPMEPAAQPSAVEPDPVELPTGESPPGDVSAPDDTSATEPGLEDAPTAGEGPPPETGAADPEPPGDQLPVEGAPEAEPQPPEPAAAGPGTATVPDTAAAGQATEPLVRIALNYVEDSWTEVSDGNGNSLYYALGRAGTTADLEGALPLSFVLGNSSGVQVSLNDQPYTLPAPQGNSTTVRFVVEETP